MIAFARYLARSILFGGAFLLIGNLLYPGDLSPVISTRSALVFGLFTNALPFLRELLGIGRDDPFPSVAYMAMGAMGLGIGAFWWYRSAPAQVSGIRLIALVCIVGFGLYYIVRGTNLMWRNRAQDSGADR